jgi:hypothetical protein
MPAMKLDTATIIVISVVIDFVLVLILLHTWRACPALPDGSITMLVFRG